MHQLVKDLFKMTLFCTIKSLIVAQNVHKNPRKVRGHTLYRALACDKTRPSLREQGHS